MTSSISDQFRRVQIIRFVLPIVLFLIVVSYETWEHILILGELRIDIHWTSEVLFFGILGPLAVFIVLSHVVSLMGEQQSAATKLEALNQDLELKVAIRTETLAARNIELAQANAELQQLDQLKSDFVSLVSHELRGPLTTLNGGLEVALQHADDMPEEAGRILRVISRESERLTQFVKNILDVSRLEAGKLALNMGPVAVLPLLQRCIEIAYPNEKRVVILNAAADLPPVWADEIYLERVILNLLTNADKYSPHDAPIAFDIQGGEECLEITVTDHGSGIPREAQPTVFDRFHRLERGDTISTKGWGLGLYFAKALTEAQDGVLTLQSPVHDSEDAPGTAFTLRLPITGEVPEDE